MTGAMKAVGDGLFGINKASLLFPGPHRLSRKVVHRTKSGLTPYLSDVEDDEPASQNYDGIVSPTAEAQLSMKSTKVPLSKEVTSRKEYVSFNTSRRVLTDITEFIPHSYFNPKVQAYEVQWTTCAHKCRIYSDVNVGSKGETKEKGTRGK